MLTNHEILKHNEVNNECEFLHFALLFEVEPDTYKKALDEKVCKFEIIEEWRAI